MKYLKRLWRWIGNTEAQKIMLVIFLGFSVYLTYTGNAVAALSLLIFGTFSALISIYFVLVDMDRRQQEDMRIKRSKAKIEEIRKLSEKTGAKTLGELVEHIEEMRGNRNERD